MKNLFNIGLDFNTVAHDASVALLTGEGRKNYVYLTRWPDGVWYAKDPMSGSGIDWEVEYHEEYLFVERAEYTGGWRIEVRYEPGAGE